MHVGVRAENVEKLTSMTSPCQQKEEGKIKEREREQLLLLETDLVPFGCSTPLPKQLVGFCSTRVSCHVHRRLNAKGLGAGWAQT